MPLKDYRELDEEDYYGQGFRKDGVISIWVGLSDDSDDAQELDVLQDLCGVGYYDLDFQEGNCFNFELVPLRRLLEEVSYSATFMDPVLEAAKAKGLTSARWLLVQFDFAYDPSRVKRPIATDPVFLGIFPYEATD